MKKAEGGEINVCLGVISPIENELKQGQTGDATKVIDNANKTIDKDMPTIDVNVGTHECGKQDNGYYRKVNGIKTKIKNKIRIEQRGIGNPEEIDR